MDKKANEIKKSEILTTDVIGYIRVSSSEQKLKGYSVDEQLKLIQEKAKAIGVEIKEDECFIDRGKSAGSFKRSELQDMLKYIATGKVRILFIKNSSRLTREPIHKESLKNVFEKYNVKVLSIEGRWTSKNPNENIGDDIQVYLDAHQRRQVSPDTLKGMQQSAEMGNWPYGGSSVPRGFDKVKNVKLGKGSYIVINEENKKYIEFIFTSLNERKFTIAEMARYYKKNKIMGLNWTERSIESIVYNDVYFGRLKAKNYTIENYTTPMISKELVLHTRKVLEIRKREPKHFYIYGGLVYCSDCQSYCKEESAYGKMKKLYKYHQCTKCGKRIRDDKVDRVVAFQMTSSLFPKEKYDLLTDLYAKKKRKAQKLNIFENEFDNFCLTEEEFKEKYIQVKTEIIKINTQISAIENVVIEKFINYSDIEKRKIALKEIKVINVSFINDKTIDVVFSKSNMDNPVKSETVNNCDIAIV